MVNQVLCESNLEEIYQFSSFYRKIGTKPFPNFYVIHHSLFMRVIYFDINKGFAEIQDHMKYLFVIRNSIIIFMIYRI